MNISIKGVKRFSKYFCIIRRILLKKPLVVVRMLGNYFRIIILKQKVVRKVEIGVTFDCQCRCAKCSSEYMADSKKKRLSLEEIKVLAQEIIQLGAVQINLTGGEPLMAPDLFEIIAALQPHQTVITVNTNGLLLSEAMIDRLEAAGVDIIKISLDSPLAEEHDISRGVAGCFDTITKALSYIQKKGKIIGQISTVCIKENLNSERIWQLVDMAERYNVLLGLTIPAASGKWMGDDSVLIGQKERGVLKELVKNTRVIRDTDEAYMRTSCPAGSEEFYVTCYGDVIPCPLIQIAFGNIREKGLKDIWERMDNFDKFKKERSGCLAGENDAFIKKFVSPIKDQKNFPVRIEDHPCCKDPQ